MSLITDASADWSAPVVLSADEVWQVRKGAAYLTTTAAPADEDGLFLHEMHAVQFSAGSTVLYRRHGDTENVIVREVV